MIEYPEPDVVRKSLSMAFFNKLTDADILARHGETRKFYISRYKESIERFTEKEKKYLNDHVIYIDRLCKRFTRFVGLKWKFVKLACCNIEQGFPHTLGDYIFLPSNFFETTVSSRQRQTLIHEKVHIFQKKFTLQTNVLILQFWKYKIHDLKKNLTDNSTIRSNPDVNDILYSRKETVCFQKYRSDNPASLGDSVLAGTCGTDTYEHPYEKMAYTIADIINNNTMKNSDYIETASWMQSYF